MKSNFGSAAIPAKQVALDPLNSLGHAMLPGIFRGNLQCDFARIGRHDLGCREMLGHRHREDSAARADIGDPRRALTPCPSPGGRGELFGQIEKRDDDQFGLRPRDEHARTDFETERIELPPPDEIGHRRSLRPLADQFAEGGPLLLVRHVFEGRIELDPLAAQGLGQQDFGVQPRRVGPATLEIVGRPLQQSADGPRGSGGHGED